MEVVILAAGKGTRMQSEIPKVMHEVGGKPMLAHVLATARMLQAQKTHVVIGHGAELIKQAFSNSDTGVEPIWVLQSEQLGTGHAVQQAVTGVDTNASANPVLVLFGDVPLVSISTLESVISNCNDDSLSLLTVNAANPKGLGRILRDGDGKIVGIVEEKDASTEQKEITEVNSGIMAIPANRLTGWLDALRSDNQQNEYYLTDIVALARKDGCEIKSSIAKSEMEVMGVNNKSQLAQVERYFQMSQIEEFLLAGLTVRDPSRIDVRGDLQFGSDCIIDCNVILEGKVSLGSGVSIGANCIIKNAKIGDGAYILPGTLIEDSEVGENACVGPMARIRPGSILGAESKIGNFVETKNARIGKGSKASHLAYLGDVEIGDGCNIGAGTIVCNYDGVNKHKTKLGNNVFVGSNSVLVAPLDLADNAFVAAGSAINTDVPPHTLAVGRAKQRNIAGWKRPHKKQ
jgi:bifunctional UDP-N-acetylglucosamine pyrophosphorylase/glucosamine-1-phosphate N-acetyltransferase